MMSAMNNRESKRRSFIVLIATFVLLLAFIVPSVDAQIVAGTITALNGSATIRRGARTIPAAYSASVNVGDQLATSPTGRITLTLIDNSQLELTESSRLLISEILLNPNNTRARTLVTLLGGMLRSLVRVTAATPPNYEVHTPNAVAAARGTTYDVYYTNNTSRPGFKNCKEFTDVLNYDGIVAVSSLANPSSPTIDLRSGQKTTVPCGLAVLSAAALSAITTGASAGGLSAATIPVVSVAGAAIVAGGVLGGYAGAGGFDSSSPRLLPASPSM